ncbi:hypothetical protein DL769_005176 [Monosporascus sp. CRB-8-3]|nr:hypothetical protein DL769_005176 [Monosporascus sp. CRB-8-3]
MPRMPSRSPQPPLDHERRRSPFDRQIRDESERAPPLEHVYDKTIRAAAAAAQRRDDQQRKAYLIRGGIRARPRRTDSSFPRGHLARADPRKEKEKKGEAVRFLVRREAGKRPSDQASD